MALTSPTRDHPYPREIEDARVRTFRRLENFLAVCTLVFHPPQAEKAQAARLDGVADGLPGLTARNCGWLEI